MITPDAGLLPGQTSFNDPLALQFMTGGQMGYMPQAQYLTPAEYGAFRTMPSPRSPMGYQTPGFLNNWLTATRGGPMGLPAYTFNTYNPMVSQRLQLAYAHRQMSDTGALLGGTMADAMLTASGIGMFGLPGLAASMLMPNMSDIIGRRIQSTRAIQNLSTAKLIVGPDTDAATGQGFSYSAARNLDRFTRMAAAKDTLFKEGDYRDMMKLGMQFGMFDYATNVEQYKRIMKNMRNSMTTMMEVLGSSDFKDIMKNFERMQTMGADMSQFNSIARREQSYARMTGLSHEDLINTYGKQGAVIFQQAGLNAMQGSLQASSNAANIAVMQRMGLITPQQLARYGGVSGMAQRMTQEDASAMAGTKDYFMPFFMNASMTGLRSDIDIGKLMSQPGGLQRVMAGASRIQTPEQMINYQRFSKDAMDQLNHRYGYDNMLMFRANLAGESVGLKGQYATVYGLRTLGYTPETAYAKARQYYSEAGKEARDRTREDALIKEREERAQEVNPLTRLERDFRTFFTKLGERTTDWYRDITNSHPDDRKTANDNGIKTRPHNPSGEEDKGIYDTTTISPNANTNTDTGIWTRKKLMSDQEGDEFLKRTSTIVFGESKSNDMGYTSTAFGPLQLDAQNIPEFFDKNGYGSKFRDKFKEHFNLDNKNLVNTLITARHKLESGTKFGALDASEQEAYRMATAGWKAVAYEPGFKGASMSFLRDNAFFKVYDSGDSRIQAVMKDEGMRRILFGMGNHEGPGGIMKVLNEALAGESLESVQASLNTGGHRLIDKLFSRADANWKGDTKNGSQRYAKNGDFYKRTIAEKNALFQKEHGGGPSAGLDYGDASQQLADVADETLKKHQNDTWERGKFDCSILTEEILNNFISKSRGVDVPAFIQDYMKNPNKLKNSTGLINGLGAEYGIGKYDLENAEDRERMLKELKSGTLIGFGGDNGNGKVSTDHIGMLIRDRNGVLNFVENTAERSSENGGGSGVQKTEFSKLIAERARLSSAKTRNGKRRHEFFYTVGLGGSIKGLGQSSLAQSRMQQGAIRTQADKEAEKLDQDFLQLKTDSSSWDIFHFTGESTSDLMHRNRVFNAAAMGNGSIEASEKYRSADLNAINKGFSIAGSDMFLTQEDINSALSGTYKAFGSDDFSNNKSGARKVLESAIRAKNSNLSDAQVKELADRVLHDSDALFGIQRRAARYIKDTDTDKYKDLLVNLDKYNRNFTADTFRNKYDANLDDFLKGYMTKIAGSDQVYNTENYTGMSEGMYNFKLSHAEEQAYMKGISSTGIARGGHSEGVYFEKLPLVYEKIQLAHTLQSAAGKEQNKQRRDEYLKAYEETRNEVINYLGTVTQDKNGRGGVSHGDAERLFDLSGDDLKAGLKSALQISDDTTYSTLAGAYDRSAKRFAGDPKAALARLNYFRNTFGADALSTLRYAPFMREGMARNRTNIMLELNKVNLSLEDLNSTDPSKNEEIEYKLKELEDGEDNEELVKFIREQRKNGIRTNYTDLARFKHTSGMLNGANTGSNINSPQLLKTDEDKLREQNMARNGGGDAGASTAIPGGPSANLVQMGDKLSGVLNGLNGTLSDMNKLLPGIRTALTLRGF